MVALIVLLFRPFKHQWELWAGELWGLVIFLATLMEAAGFIFKPVPTLSDLIASGIRRLGRIWGRISVLAALAFLFHHFFIAPFRDE